MTNLASTLRHIGPTILRHLRGGAAQDTTLYISRFMDLRAGNTSRTYGAAVRQLEAFTGRPIEETGPGDVLGYLTSLKAQGLSDNTIRIRYAALSVIFAYLEDMGQVDKTPIRAMRRALRLTDTQVRPTALIDDSDVIRAFSGCCESRVGVRDAAILAVLFYCGLRRGEAARLRLSDYRQRDGVRFLYLAKTKGGRQAEQGVPDAAIPYLAALIEQRRSEGAEVIDPLFCTYFKRGRTKALSESSLYRIFKQRFFMIGVDAAPHSARATAATALKSRGVQDRDVATFLRHLTTKMVQVYDKRHRSIRINAALNLRYDCINSLVGKK